MLGEHFACQWPHSLLCNAAIQFGNGQKSVSVSAVHWNGDWHIVMHVFCYTAYFYIKKNEMGGICSKYGERRGVYSATLSTANPPHTH